MKRSSIRLITLAALSTACLAANLFGTVQAAPAPNAKLPVVAVQAVEMLPQTVSRRLAGRVTALHTVNITARVSGEIKEVAFADGALVKKGDVLYRLDDVQYQAATISVSRRFTNRRPRAAMCLTPPNEPRKPLLPRSPLPKQR